MLISFEPATTTAAPLLFNNSLAAKVTAVCALLAVIPPAKEEPVTALYNEINTAASSEGLMAIRTSAFDPVILRPDSN
ncbi:hypothetical protein D3C87_1231590 [compost metagenome]